MTQNLFKAVVTAIATDDNEAAAKHFKEALALKMKAYLKEANIVPQNSGFKTGDKVKMTNPKTKKVYQATVGKVYADGKADLDYDEKSKNENDPLAKEHKTNAEQDGRVCLKNCKK